jgi:hypothetical protein
VETSSASFSYMILVKEVDQARPIAVRNQRHVHIHLTLTVLYGQASGVLGNLPIMKTVPVTES